MWNKLVGALAALVIALGAVATTSSNAQAGHGHHDGAAIVGGAILGFALGAAVASRHDHYYGGYVGPRYIHGGYGYRYYDGPRYYKPRRYYKRHYYGPRHRYYGKRHYGKRYYRKGRYYRGGRHYGRGYHRGYKRGYKRAWRRRHWR